MLKTSLMIFASGTVPGGLNSRMVRRIFTPTRNFAIGKIIFGWLYTDSTSRKMIKKSFLF